MDVCDNAKCGSRARHIHGNQQLRWVRVAVSFTFVEEEVLGNSVFEASGLVAAQIRSSFSCDLRILQVLNIERMLSIVEHDAVGSLSCKPCSIEARWKSLNTTDHEGLEGQT